MSDFTDYWNDDYFTEVIDQPAKKAMDTLDTVSDELRAVYSGYASHMDDNIMNLEDAIARVRTVMRWIRESLETEIEGE